MANGGYMISSCWLTQRYEEGETAKRRTSKNRLVARDIINRSNNSGSGVDLMLF